MVLKTEEIESVAVRKPRQQRSRHKVELILEAAIRLLDKRGPAALTTNAVAETAGVSIGTLYQYFPNKDAILDALAERESAIVAERVIAAIADPAPVPPRERIAAIVRAVNASYGERRRVHRLILERSLAKGAKRLEPLLPRLMALLTSQRPECAAVPGAMSPADAFVLTNAFIGVMRAMILRDEGEEPGDAAIEEALARLVLRNAAGE